MTLVQLVLVVFVSSPLFRNKEFEAVKFLCTKFKNNSNPILYSVGNSLDI